MTESSACGFYSIHGIIRYPVALYGLRQSTLIHCSASRRILGGNGFSRLVCGKDHRYEVFCREKRERRRLACLVWEKQRESEEGGSSLDVGVEEILSLLDSGSVKESDRKDRSIGRKSQNMGCGRNREETSKFAGKSSQKIEIQKGGFSEMEKKSRFVEKLDGRSTKVLDEAVDLTIDGRRNSRKEDIFGGSDSFVSRSKNVAMIKSREIYRSSKFQNSLRIDDYVEREEGSESNCSLSSSGDYENNKGVILTSDQGFSKENNTRTTRMQEEEGKEHYMVSSSNYENNVRSGLGQERISFFGEKQVQKLDNGRNYGESSTKAQAALEEIADESMKHKVTAKINEMEYNTNVSLSTNEGDAKLVSGKQSELVTRTTVKDKEKKSTSVLVDVGWESREQLDRTEQRVSGKHESWRQNKVEPEIGVLAKSERYSAEQNEQLDQTEQQISGRCESWRQNKMESEIGVLSKSDRNSAQHNGQFDQTEQQVSRKCESWRQNKVELESGVVDTSEIYSSQQTYISRTGRLEESHDLQMDSRNTGSGTSSSMLPSSQPLTRGSMGTVTDGQPVESADQEVSVECVHYGSGDTYTNPQGEVPWNSYKLDPKTRKDENSVKSSGLITANSDALTSAICLEETSEKFVREFVDKVQQEILFSHESHRTSKQTIQMEMERSSETTASTLHQSSLDDSAVYQHAGLSKKISDNFHMRDDGTEKSSRRLGTRGHGSSDEIWDVAQLSSSEPSRLETSEKDLLQMTSGGGSTEGFSTVRNSIMRRSSRSLWSYIPEIFHKGWGARVETNNSMLNMGKRNSSTEYGSSGAWFSGHGHDDNQNVKEDKTGVTKEPSAAKNLADQPYTRQQATGFDDRNAPVETASTLEVPLEQGSLSKGASFLVSGKEIFGKIEGEMQKLGSRLIIDNNEQAISERSKIKVPLEKMASSYLTTEIGEGSGRERLTEAVWIEGKEGELKKRRLKRNMQVPKERLEEWEEAFNHETEQRKTDEMFMKEALLEAKKAAGAWEVPVGAVLVQDGKIIARGFNLVEDKRDSTAHAEMICIREASSLLRTWRLAGTTLYITLEPCPMCAGAILQARIDAVVWGAPNKLLGADGSWISLFPCGEEGRNSSDQLYRMVAPIHPFHPNMTVRRGILARECSDVMQQFFQLRRKKKKPESPPSCMPISNPSKFLTKIHNIFSMMFCL